MAKHVDGILGPEGGTDPDLRQGSMIIGGVPRRALAGVVALSLAIVMVSSVDAHAALVPSRWIRGANVTGYYPRDVFRSSMADRTLQTLRQDGANTAAVVLECWMSTASSISIGCSDSQTMSDAGVAHALAKTRALGMRAILKPVVDSHDNMFRGFFTPTDWGAWFASYRAMMNHYAVLAQQSGAWMLVVGTELTSSETCGGCAGQWRQTIAEIRARFHGKLTYGANVETVAGFPAWEKLDYIGDDGYFEMGSPTQADPGVPALVRAWSTFRDPNGVVRHWLSLLHGVSRQYHKQLLFVECGAESRAGAAAYFDRHLPNRVNVDAQAHIYEAIMRVFDRQSWFAGMLVWNYQVDRRPKLNDIDWDPRAKPAEDILRQWWR